MDDQQITLQEPLSPDVDGKDSVVFDVMLCIGSTWPGLDSLNHALPTT